MLQYISAAIGLLRVLLRMSSPPPDDAPRPAPPAPGSTPPPPSSEPAPPARTVYRMTMRDEDRVRYGGATDPAIRAAVERADASGTWITDREKIERLMEKALQREMAPLGWAPDQELMEYAASITPGLRLVELSRNGRQYRDIMPPSHMVINAGFVYKQQVIGRRIPMIEDVWEDLKPLLRVQQDPSHFTLYFRMELCYPGIVDEPDWDPLFYGMLAIPTPDGLADYGKRFAAVYRDHLLPVMERCRDLRAVCDDSLKDFASQAGMQGFVTGDGAAVRRLILARLAGDERYEALYEYEMARETAWLGVPEEHPSMAHLANYPQVFREVYQRLKSIPPLENPVLD
jgi:hypothetical protein